MEKYDTDYLKKVLYTGIICDVMDGLLAPHQKG